MKDLISEIDEIKTDIDQKMEARLQSEEKAKEEGKRISKYKITWQ